MNNGATLESETKNEVMNVDQTGNAQQMVAQTNHGISNSASTQPSTVNNTELIVGIDQSNSGAILQDSTESIIQKIRNERIQAIDDDINALNEIIEERRTEIIEAARSEWQNFIDEINDPDVVLGDEKPKRKKSVSTTGGNTTKSRAATTAKSTANDLGYIRGQVSLQAKTFFKEQYKKLVSQGKSADAAVKRIQTMYMKAKTNPTPGKSYTIESIRKVVGVK